MPKPQPKRAKPPTSRSRLERLRRGQRRRGPAEEPALPAPAAVSEDPAPRADHRWARLLRSLVRPGRGQLIAAVMLFGVGLAGAMQIRMNSADDAYTTARREDLVVLLDGLGEESRRLEREIADLDRTRTELRSGADTQRVAQQEARNRLDELSVLAGTVPAVGPGIRLRINDPARKLTPDVLINTVGEMRDAGAEVIEIDDRVRVVASTWFGNDGRGLVVDGVVLSDPVTLEVIGDPYSLEEAARFRGGIVSEITGPRIGGSVQIDRLDRVVVESLRVPRENQYAQPASPQPRPR